jgi:uncharacterized delta-60 repeat protein
MTRLELTALDARTTPATVRGLDVTFNTTGLADIAFDLAGTRADLGAAVAVQADGKVIVVGTARSGTADTDFAVARLNPDGTFDATFGTNGLRTVGFDLGGDNKDAAAAVAVLADGSIVVAGSAQVDAAGDFDFAVARLTPAGQLDTTFDGDGRQTVGFDVIGSTNDDRAAGVAVDSNNRVVLAGTVALNATGDTDFGVARLLADGSLDAAFDADGRQTVAFDHGGANADAAAGLVLDPTDAVVVAGTVQVGGAGDADFAVARLLPSGALDRSFNEVGLVIVPVNGGGTNADVAAGIARDLSGRYVVAGTAAVPAGLDIGVVRLTADGQLDSAFNGNGKTTFGFDRGGGNNDRAAGVAVHAATGAVLVAATVDAAAGKDTDLGVARLTAAGQLDPTFASTGRTAVAFDRGGGNADAAGGIAVDAIGRAVVVGTVETVATGDTDLGVARLVANTNHPQELLVAGPPTGTVQTFVTVGTGFTNQGTSAGPAATATVRPAVADLNGDGILDQILGAGPGTGSRVRLLLGSLTPGAVTPFDFDAFEKGFTGGVYVAAADIDLDGRAEFVVSPDVGGGPRATVYSLAADNTPVKRTDFFGIDDPNFRGGARVALGDINADGRPDLVVGAGFRGGPRVAVFNGATLFDPLGATPRPPKLVNDFFAFPGKDATTLRNGVFVTVGDLDGDAFGDLVFGGGPGGGPRVYALSGRLMLTQPLDAVYNLPVANFFVNNDSLSRGGIRPAVKDLDGDGRADLVTGSGDKQPSRVRVYRGASFPLGNGDEPPLVQEIDPFAAPLATGVFVG